MAKIDKDAIIEAYEDVRDDKTETSWMVMSYQEDTIHVAGKGDDYDEFLKHFSDDERIFGYVRVTSGDELSKRAKFVLITWSGSNVSAMKRAKISVDKSSVKSAIKSFAIEVMTDELSELNYDAVVEKARKAGGANYGTGV